MDTAKQYAAHLRDYLKIIAARRWMVLVSLAVVVASAMTWAYLQTPLFRASARVHIEKAKPKVIRTKKFEEFEVIDPAPDYYETQYHLIADRGIVEPVFEQLGLDRLKEFQEFPDPVQAFCDLIEVTPIRGSRLVDIRFMWQDPLLAADVVNAVTDAYLRAATDKSRGTFSLALKELNREAELTAQALEQAKSKMKDFIDKRHSVSVAGAENIVAQRLSQLNQAVTSIEIDRVRRQAQVGAAEKVLAGGQEAGLLAEIMDSPTIQALQLMLSQAQAEAAELSKRYQKAHPAMQAAEARIAAMEQKIALESRKILIQAKGGLDRTKAEERQLMAKFIAQKETMRTLDHDSLDFALLKTEVDRRNKQYDIIVARINELEIDSGFGASNISIVHHAAVPVLAAWPNKKLILLASCVAGLVLGISLAFFTEYLDNTIHGEEDVAEHLGLTILGRVPRIFGLQRKDAVVAAGDFGGLHRVGSAVGEAFRGIRTGIIFSEAGRTARSLLITSASPREGKTVTSLNVGISLAMNKWRVLIVDSDLRRPRLNRLLNVNRGKGLSDLLTGEAELDEVIRPTGIDNLSFLSAGTIPPNPSELLGSSAMKDLIARLEAKFDQVIFDSPALDQVTDARVLATMISGIVYVVRSFTTPSVHAKWAAASFKDSKDKILGVIINDADMTKRSRYYGRYGYASGYGSYYGDNGDNGDDGDNGGNGGNGDREPEFLSASSGSSRIG